MKLETILNKQKDLTDLLQIQYSQLTNIPTELKVKYLLSNVRTYNKKEIKY